MLNINNIVGVAEVASVKQKNDGTQIYITKIYREKLTF